MDYIGTYYQTSIRRLRRNMRDDLQRELMTTRLLTDVESADWINNFMSRFWLIYEPGLSAQIIGTADAILIDSTPSFLDSIRLSTFTLGTKAPRIEGIKTYPRTEPNVVVRIKQKDVKRRSNCFCFCDFSVWIGKCPLCLMIPLT